MIPNNYATITNIIFEMINLLICNLLPPVWIWEV